MSIHTSIMHIQNYIMDVWLWVYINELIDVNNYNMDIQICCEF